MTRKKLFCGGVVVGLVLGMFLFLGAAAHATSAGKASYKLFEIEHDAGALQPYLVEHPTSDFLPGLQFNCRALNIDSNLFLDYHRPKRVDKVLWKHVRAGVTAFVETTTWCASFVEGHPDAWPKVLAAWDAADHEFAQIPQYSTTTTTNDQE